MCVLWNSVVMYLFIYVFTHVCTHQQPPQWVWCNKRTIFMGVQLVWIQGFSFYKISSKIKSLVGLFTHCWREKDWFIPFPGELARIEMQKASSRIWTRAPITFPTIITVTIGVFADVSTYLIVYVLCTYIYIYIGANVFTFLSMCACSCMLVYVHI